MDYLAYLKKKLYEVSHKPGVYLHKDQFGSVIYVGKAKDLRKRISSYFFTSKNKLSDHKTRALINSIRDFDYHEVKNESEAFILESNLIKKYRPKYNVILRDDKRYLLVKINLNELWPKFTLTRVKKNDGATYFGPFAHSNALRETLEWVNKNFGLRNCKPSNINESTFKHCNDDIIRNCKAPCINRITREDYLNLVNEACGFLLGKSKQHIKLIEIEMKESALNCDFEKAAKFRDIIENIKKTLVPTRKFNSFNKLGSTINPLGDIIELKKCLNLDRVPYLMECFDISNISSTYIVASMVRFKNGVPDKNSYNRYRIKSVKNQDDFASMGEVVRRRYSKLIKMLNASDLENKLTIKFPDLIIVDGGKGQLSSAFSELKKLGVSKLNIIGLAKKNEEIFFHNKKTPLILPKRSGALKLLQRIRDEAHNFANGYHQILMKKRIEESILDGCKDVGKLRKEKLLNHFGSIKNIRKASIDNICEVPGFSHSLSSKIKLFLDINQ